MTELNKEEIHQLLVLLKKANRTQLSDINIWVHKEAINRTPFGER